MKHFNKEVFSNIFNFFKQSFLIIMFLTAMLFNSCIRMETEVRFPEEHLNKVRIYSVGDKFYMINSQKDTIVFTIIDEKLEK